MFCVQSIPTIDGSRFTMDASDSVLLKSAIFFAVFIFAASSCRLRFASVICPIRANCA